MSNLSSLSSDTQPVIDSKRFTGSGRIVGLLKWEGRIVDLDNDFFTAELVSIEGSGAQVTAEFDTDLLDRSDSEELRVGTLFYLTVRTVSDRGLRARTSTMVLRRLGAWTTEDMDAIETHAEGLREALADLWE